MRGKQMLYILTGFWFFCVCIFQQWNVTPLPSWWVLETSGSRLPQDNGPHIQYQFTSHCLPLLPSYLSILITSYIWSLKVSQGHISLCLLILAEMTTALLHISPLLLINLLSWYVPLICWEPACCKATNPFRQSESFRERKLAWVQKVKRKECENSEGSFWRETEWMRETFFNIFIFSYK